MAVNLMVMCAVIYGASIIISAISGTMYISMKQRSKIEPTKDSNLT